VHGPVAAERLCVEAGKHVRVGDALTSGAPWLDDLLRLRGIEAVRRHLLRECRGIYRDNGVSIDEKHFEVILSRIVSRWRVETSGDTELAPGAVVGWKEFVEANQKLAGRVRITEAGSAPLSCNHLLEESEFLAHRRKLAARQRPPRAVSAAPATATPLGITLVALEVDSFLSAAGFQDTREVLMEAALAGKVDSLQGLMENVLLGRLIPAGTGFTPAAGVSGSS
jgi:DNA-directed RNA polymerase subunit beta'